MHSTGKYSDSHRFVMDYLLEEVLHQQPEHVQTFLLRTSILDRLCGPLCEAVCSTTEELTPRPPLLQREQAHEPWFREVLLQSLHTLDEKR